MTTTTEAPTRDELRAHLVAARIAGEVATPREGNLANFRRLARREPLYLFGLEPEAAWTFEDVLALMAERCGVNPDPAHTYGQDTIDPDRTLDRLDAMADRLGEAAARRERVLVATGHPVGLRPTHTAVARGLLAAGCTLLTPAEGWEHPADPGYEYQTGTVRYVDGVGALGGPGGTLSHTHSPLPMRAALAALGEPPDLVVADHGWAGAAGQAGVDAVGFADCNDPALFVGEAEGRVLVSVPLDDNVAPHLYAPLTAYLVERAGLPA
ncbi:MAG TPA: phosphatase [Mycobacteriales bacterium]